MKGNFTGDGEFDRCILLSAYTAKKFIPAIMLYMSTDLAESRTIMMQKSHERRHSTDINTFTMLFLYNKLCTGFFNYLHSVLQGPMVHIIGCEYTKTYTSSSK